MIYTLERLSDPEIEPVTLDEMKVHLREYEETTAQDDQLTELITGGREWVENYTGRALIDQSWRLTLIGPVVYGGFSGDAVRGFVGYPLRLGYYSGAFSLSPRGEILLRKSPVLSITSVQTIDQAGVIADVAAGTYELREAKSKWPRIFPLNTAIWLANGLVGSDLRVEFRGGYADRGNSPLQGAEVVPRRYKQAIKLWVEANYDRDPKMMPQLLSTAESLIESECTELRMA